MDRTIHEDKDTWSNSQKKLNIYLTWVVFFPPFFLVVVRYSGQGHFAKLHFYRKKTCISIKKVLSWLRFIEDTAQQHLLLFKITVSLGRLSAFKHLACCEEKVVLLVLVAPWAPHALVRGSRHYEFSIQLFQDFLWGRASQVHITHLISWKIEANQLCFEDTLLIIW